MWTNRFGDSIGVLFALSLLKNASAANSSDAEAACSAISDRYPGQVATSAINLNFTLASDYTEARTDYWSAANADVEPSCIFFPGSANDVAYAVQVLNNHTSAAWAVKGGGHNPNVGFSSTDGGVLIAMQNMATTTLDDDNNAHVGAGSSWEDAQTTLDPYGRAVVGGRIGEVGVAGYTLGGGLSFLSGQYGFAADAVKNFEIITAEGEVTNANSTSDSDLFYAMKGGGGQFAIVTTYVLQTYPIGQVWGGHRVYTLDKKDQVLSATHNLTGNYHDDKAAVIVTFTTTLDDLIDIFLIFYYYNDPTGPGSILDEFLAIDYLIDETSSNRVFGELLKANDFFSLKGQRYLIREGTLPNLPGSNGTDLYHHAFSSWFDLAKKYQTEAIDNFIFNMAFQPIPHQLVEASQNTGNGGNRLGLDPSTGDHFFIEYDASWLLSSSDSDAADYITNMTQPAQDYAKSTYAGVPPTNYQSGDVDFTNYNPVFMNDAMYNQDPLRSYGDETYERLRQIHNERDPSGLFDRTGGFKFTE
ncbi:hypothetical protein KC343_g12959 [Hortaea werneckii]|uniref:FAD-binding PCMH-type domain-containing protein n=1 Tax=Hortaea werneckii TaxID=91943 RepID=A0A3M7EAU3_HORWE|nr:hypothetical protein KC320_g6952 [Hortaea werneckii]KAI7569923.1 hypothetical protein KC317_g2904 [Hortaea werneckii]KAI7607748.1 hypothetical protein KC343_g12959 [Hortaea werneckii]KAI7624386.1 hypothetical protein KC346_g2243 [Hortaea werneckii]KAI7680775.1 hypothetical protein KC319_g1974 [Hortaea werneckii]